jgi:putative NIF3 family GTP cyclohydrolase 1 type 2
MSLNRILYNYFDPDLLVSEPDEWGCVDHCLNPASIGYATTLTPTVIQQAIELGIDLIVSHHDSWDFMFEERRVSHQLLGKHRISHIWCHLPLDRADFGTATALLTSIGCRIIGILADDCGRIGELPRKLDLLEVIRLFNEQLGEVPCRIHDSGKAIIRIAGVPGAGNMNEYLEQARDHKADLYITGETSLYLLEYASHLGINVLVYSHNYTENFGTRNLAQRIAGTLNIDSVVRLDEPHF